MTLVAAHSDDGKWHAFDPHAPEPEAICGKYAFTIFPNIEWTDVDQWECEDCMKRIDVDE